MDLNPQGEPPTRGARWCPRCQCWYPFAAGRRRCAVCFTALVRPTRREIPREGELRPGVLAEFRDPRDWPDPAPVIAALRQNLVKG